MPVVIEMEVAIGMLEMRDPMTPLGAATEQVAVEDLLALASPP